MKHIEVMVSMHYRGKGWKDESTGVFFEDSRKPRVYRIPAEGDISSIETAIRQNLLMLVSGDLQEAVERDHVEVVETKVEEEPAKEEVKEEKEEAPLMETKQEEDLSEKTLSELKAVAKERGIEHKTKITRKELLGLLEG